MEIKEGQCPKCGSDLHHGVIEPEDSNSIFYPATCTKEGCEFEGKEYHDLSFSGFYDNDGNEITE